MSTKFPKVPKKEDKKPLKSTASASNVPELICKVKKLA